MRFASHPLWLVPFRPFFALVCISGAILPILWVLMFAGRLDVPASAFTAIQWHAHEMFFGFGGAMVGGFLLTAGKNWVKIRGIHGAWLIFLAAAWLFERIGMWYAGHWPAALFLLSNQLFFVTIVLMMGWMLLSHRAVDSYRADNPYLIVMLPLFPVAKYLLLDGHYNLAGETMTLGLFRLTFLIMLERTLTDFIKGVFKRDILRQPWLDHPIKLLALALAFAGFMPPLLTASLAVLLAALLLVRLPFWEPRLGLSRIDIGIMYAGYLAIALQLLAVAYEQALKGVWVGSVVTHLFTFGVMGLIIPAMIVRISKGHTGRKVSFDKFDKAVLWIMIAGLVVRVLLPQVVPAIYLRWLDMAAACWSLAFAILGWRYIPFLLQPRVDGREH